jgi:hypothetical protein
MGDSDVIKAHAHSNVQVLLPNSPGVPIFGMSFGDRTRARRRILSEPRRCCRRRGTPLFGVALALALYRSRADMRIALAFALVACAALVASAADEDYATAAPPSSLVTPEVAQAPARNGTSAATGCEACCGGGDCAAAFRGTPGTCCGVLGGRPFCCPTAASTYGAATCYRANDVFRCRREGAPSAGGEVRRVSPWYALFSLLIPFACLAMCCYACFRRPSQPPPPAPYYAATQEGPYHTQTGGYPVPQRQQGYGASNLAGAGASAYAAPPPPPNPPPTPSAPTYPPTYPPNTPNPYARPPPPFAT